MSQEIRDIILNHAEFRARTEKGIIGDKIYPGVFRNTLFAHSIGSRELSQAIKENLIEEVRLRPVGRTERVGYIWLGMELKQVTPFKKFVVRLKKLWADCKAKFRRAVRLLGI